MHIGLTGGIGSGKSTVGALLAQKCGAVVVDADGVAKFLTQKNGAAIAPIRREFGDEFITHDGALDRAKMRALVFSNPESKHRLERILHPLIRASMMQTARLQGQSRKVLVFDIPLLVESYDDWRSLLDVIWVIECSRETQIRRVCERSGLEREVIEAIIDAQATAQQRRQVADIIIVNDNISCEELRREIMDAMERTRALMM